MQNTDVRDCLIDPNNILDDNPDNRDACLTIDPDGGILEANESASQLFGLGSLDHSPNILDYFHPGAVFHARKNLARVAQGEPLTFTLVLKEPNGTFRPYEVICHPVLKNATYCSTLLIFHPTSLQVLGEELNDARLRADLILCAPDVASWERHLQTNEFTSHNLDTLLGRVPPHSIHSYEDFCKTIHEQDILRYMETCQQAMDTHTVGSVDYRVCLDSGQIKWFCDRFRVLKDADGHAVKLIGITRDMTLLQDNLSNEAQYCPLTGLPNRNLFRQ
ncbi:MAG: PAS domain-containing protein, partial [Pseudomonadota bacterium]|nr:PAS domain-containing protein [Pseudomonadota bacterium]